MFMITSYWWGALHIDPMRLFTTEQEARDYATLLDGEVRLYQLFADKPPKRIKL